MDDFSFPLNGEPLDLRLYQCGREQCAPLHSFGPFVRKHYLFHYIISGRGVLVSGAPDEETAAAYRLEAGQGFLICPGQTNICRADQDEPWSYVWIEFDGLRAAGYLDAAGLGIAQPVYRSNNGALADELRDAMLYIADHPEASVLQRTGRLCLFLDTLIQSSSARREPRGSRLRDFYIREAINFMEQNYQRDLTVQELADVCKLNRSYFSKLFKEHQGCPPQEFLIRMRLFKAAELMKTTAASIGDIAVACGYPNQLHFSRSFRQHYGTSPRAWRSQNKLREKEEP